MKQRSMFGKIKYRGTKYRGTRGLAAWERRTIAIATDKGPAREAEGLVDTECAGLGLHRSLEKNTRGKHNWVVAHLQSGMRIVSHPSKQSAQGILKMLCEGARRKGFTWDAPAEVLRSRETWDVVVEARNRYEKGGRKVMV